MSVILLLFALQAHASPDFKIEVIVHQADSDKQASIYSAQGKCSSTNGAETKSRDAKVCDELRKAVASETYSDLPWINSPHIAYMTVHYKGTSEWTRETGVKPDPKAKNREALRKLAVRVLDLVQ